MKQVKQLPTAIEVIVSRVPNNELTSWKRMMKKMDKLIDKIRPLEEEILGLTAAKMPIFDKIQELRMEMVKVCIHPKEHLVEVDKYILCKFCDKKLQVGRNAKGKK